MDGPLPPTNIAASCFCASLSAPSLGIDLGFRLGRDQTLLMSQPSSVGFALIRTTRGRLRTAPRVTSRSLKKHKKERKAKRKAGGGGAKQNEEGKEQGRGEKEDGAEMEGRR